MLTLKKNTLQPQRAHRACHHKRCSPSPRMSSLLSTNYLYGTRLQIALESKQTNGIPDNDHSSIPKSSQVDLKRNAPVWHRRDR
ncbi:hypothetical protein LshimejAT787_0309870 [Lyophyllum shimeji]|uniref:Uncharacterized protein n=1 Tax=Lyophyllum shimeji TaxID=47721 RepID=A0A9P3UMF2_LYOSH|nr:hypothetical protein LshimejAT787_0309870 [Lyophyllum shimeji]